MSRKLVTVLLALCLAAAGLASAHASLESSEPASGSTSHETLAVTLVFTEAVEVGFSTFKVFRLPDALAAVGMPAHDEHDQEGSAEADHASHAEDEHASDEHASDEHASDEHASGEDGDGHAGDHSHDSPSAGLDPALAAEATAVATAALADDGFDVGEVAALVTPEGADTEVSIVFAGPLPPGTYVVVWRVLSVDTHSSDGWVAFTVVD